MLIAALLLFGCEPNADDASSEAVSDPLLQAAPMRVVSLSPLASRFALALDAGALLMAVDARSSLLPELEHLPIVEASAAVDLAPDLILIPERGALDPLALGALEGAGTRVVEFAPHNLEDVSALFRSLGRELVGRARAERFEFDMSRSLARIGGSSWGKPRPNVVAMIRVDPPVLAGGHSFETDLIEIAGGRSLTHGGGEQQIPLDAVPDVLTIYSPDLVLVMTPNETSRSERHSTRTKLAGAPRVEFFTVDTQTFWLESPALDAARLRALIEPISRELASTRSGTSPSE